MSERKLILKQVLEWIKEQQFQFGNDCVEEIIKKIKAEINKK